MPTNYNGNAANVSLATAVSISEPAGGDAPNAASVNTPLSKLADYLEAIRTKTTGAVTNGANIATGQFGDPSLTRCSNGTVLLTAPLRATAAIGTFVTIATLPVGFRPAVPQYLSVWRTSGGTQSTFPCHIGTDGTIQTDADLLNTDEISISASFLGA